VASWPYVARNFSRSKLDEVGFLLEYIVTVLERLTALTAGSATAAWAPECLRLSRFNVGDTVDACGCPLDPSQRLRCASFICLFRRSELSLANARMNAFSLDKITR
jgi:hypothetical protein